MDSLVTTTVIDNVRQLDASRYARSTPYTHLSYWSFALMSTRFIVVCMTVILYDHGITLGREVELVWKSSWSLVKALFFAVRYYTLFTGAVATFGLFYQHMTDNMCTNFARWDLFTTFVSTVLVQAVLQIRVYAIYARSRLILLIMALFYAISIGLAGWIVIIDMSMAKSSVVTLVPGGQLQGCSFPNLSSKSPILWISPLIFEAILYILVLYKGWQMFRTTRHLPTHQGSSSGGLLLGILVRDSVIYFFILSLIYFSTVIAWGVKDLNGYIDIMGAFTTTMTGVLGSKMILNLRHAGTAGSSSTELTGPFSQDVIEFARKEEC